MIIHREGFQILFGLAISLTALQTVVYLMAPPIFAFSMVLAVILFLLVLQFFRNPTRKIALADPKLVYAPADGKVVVIETTEETEYFRDRRLQVSIFMSPLNVHVNRNGIGGAVSYTKYHPGKFLVAWHPKASTENERNTVVINNGETEVLFRQIAGAVARRIKNYLNQGDRVAQGGEMGFIKFGSRVDIFLPLNAEILVQLDQKAVGNQTVIAKLP